MINALQLWKRVGTMKSNTFNNFSTGIIVSYKTHVGEIRFVDENYLTVCISVNPDDRVRDVCLVIPKQNWDEVRLIKESNK